MESKEVRGYFEAARITIAEATHKENVTILNLMIRKKRKKVKSLSMIGGKTKEKWAKPHLKKKY